MSTSYTYAACLENAYKVNWRIDDVIGGRAFDLEKRWLPMSLSGASRIGCLDEEEQRKLTQVEMAAYTHLFGYVEEFIAPKISSLAQDFEVDGREAFDALTNFAAEEVKHMNLFRQLRVLVDETLGFETLLLGGQAETARFVLSKSTGAVLLLTAVIEWFTQRHFQEAFREDDDLDAFTKDIFRAHWQEESQHAKMDHLETLRAFEAMNDAERDQSIDELIELVGAVDGLLQKQAGYDVENLARHLDRELTIAETREVYEGVLAAKRWTFIESGTTHPNFGELFLEVTTADQQARVGAALASVLGTTPQPA